LASTQTPRVWVAELRMRTSPPELAFQNGLGYARRRRTVLRRCPNLSHLPKKPGNTTRNGWKFGRVWGRCIGMRMGRAKTVPLRLLQRSFNRLSRHGLGQDENGTRTGLGQDKDRTSSPRQGIARPRGQAPIAAAFNDICRAHIFCRQKPTGKTRQAGSSRLSAFPSAEA
jgi:hypothetical protein